MAGIAPFFSTQRLATALPKRANSFRSSWVSSSRCFSDVLTLYRKPPQKESPRLAEHWEDYLNHLAFAMKNLNLIINAPIIISGYLAPYFTEEDITYLLEHINTGAPFTLNKDQILVGTHGQYTPAIGEALYYVEKFIQSV